MNRWKCTCTRLCKFDLCPELVPADLRLTGVRLRPVPAQCTEWVCQFSGFGWTKNTEQNVGWALWGFTVLTLSYFIYWLYILAYFFSSALLAHFLHTEEEITGNLLPLYITRLLKSGSVGTDRKSSLTAFIRSGSWTILSLLISQARLLCSTSSLRPQTRGIDGHIPGKTVSVQIHKSSRPLSAVIYRDYSHLGLHQTYMWHYKTKE